MHRNPKLSSLDGLNHVKSWGEIELEREGTAKGIKCDDLECFREEGLFWHSGGSDDETDEGESEQDMDEEL